jgi:hypothetical protein
VIPLLKEDGFNQHPGFQAQVKLAEPLATFSYKCLPKALFFGATPN